MIKLFIPLLVVVLIATTSGWSIEPNENPLIGDRPDFTESAATIAPGRFQLEAGFTNTRVKDVNIDSIGEILIRIGVVKFWELRIGLNSYTITDTISDTVSEAPGKGDITGLENVTIGFKFRFLDNRGARPALALLLSTSLPVGSSEYRVSMYQPRAVLAAGWELTPTLSLGANLGYAYLAVDEVKFNQVSGSVSMAVSLGGRWGLYAEWFGLSLDHKDGTDLHFVNSGVTFLALANLQFDFRVGRGLNGIDKDDFIGAGLVFRL